MLDQEFCTFLEYQLSKAFIYSSDTSIQYFGCDGVLLPLSDKDLSQKSINDKRYVSMTAYIGFDGQDKYELILNFGRKALSRYARGLDIKECIPPPTDSGWYEVDQINKVVIVNLL